MQLHGGFFYFLFLFCVCVGLSGEVLNDWRFSALIFFSFFDQLSF